MMNAKKYSFDNIIDSSSVADVLMFFKKKKDASNNKTDRAKPIPSLNQPKKNNKIGITR